MQGHRFFLRSVPSEAPAWEGDVFLWIPTPRGLFFLLPRFSIGLSLGALLLRCCLIAEI